MKQTKRPGQFPPGLVISSIVRDVDEPTIVYSGLSNYEEIALSEITPRPINKYRQSRIEQLAESIRRTNNKLINPIVVVKGADLPKTSEVRKAFEEQGISVAELKYIVVAGERRFRAFQYLQEQEKENNADSSAFTTITAHVLTAEEALNEQIYYKDSNNQARHLTPGEVVWFIKDALKDVTDASSKRKAMIAMNNGSEEGIDENALIAANSFRTDYYCRWLIEREYGITDWTDGSLRNMAAVAKNCIDDVVDALITGEFPLTEAKRISSLSSDNQRVLLEKYKTDRVEYESYLAQIKAVKSKKITHKESRKAIKSIIKSNEKMLDDLKVLVMSIDGDVSIESRCLDCISSCISELSTLMESYKK